MNAGHENQPLYDTLNISRVTVTTTAAALTALPPGLYYLRNGGDADITLGSSDAVTAGAGFTLAAGDLSPPIVLTKTSLIYAIVAAGTQALEIFGQC